MPRPGMRGRTWCGPRICAGLVGRVPLARVMIRKEAGRVVDLHPL